jgi:hypothetical protein
MSDAHWAIGMRTELPRGRECMWFVSQSGSDHDMELQKVDNKYRGWDLST